MNPANVLRKGRSYAGFDYRTGEAVTRTGADWRARCEGLRVKRDDDGALAAYRGATRQFEIYPEG